MRGRNLVFFYYPYLNNDKQTPLATIVRTAAVSWHAFVSPHFTYVSVFYNKFFRTQVVMFAICVGLFVRDADGH